MGILDIVLLLCFVPAIVSGLSNGFIKELLSTVAIVAGAWIAYKFHGPVSELLATYITLEPKVLSVIAFILVIVITALILSLLGNLVTKVFEMATLGWLNRLMGLVFGIFKTALLLGILVMAFDGINSNLGLVKESTLEGSAVYGAINEFAQAFFPYLKTLLTSSADAATTINV